MHSLKREYSRWDILFVFQQCLLKCGEYTTYSLIPSQREKYTYFIHSYYFNLASQAVKDWHLALFVLAAALIDLFLLGLLTIYKGGRQEAYLVKNYEKPSEERGVSSHCFPLKQCMHLVILSFRLLAILQTTMFTLVILMTIIFGLGLYLVSRQYFKLPHSSLPLAFEKWKSKVWMTQSLLASWCTFPASYWQYKSLWQWHWITISLPFPFYLELASLSLLASY